MADSVKSLPRLKAKLKCPFCFKIFDDGPALIKHLACHNYVSKKNISSEASLPQCYVRLVRCDNLVRCSVKPEIPTEPGISEKGEVGLKKTLEYVKIRTKKGEVLFRCTKCPKMYRQRKNARVHFWNHSGKKPYRCTFCDCAFTRSDILKKHTKIHTGEKQYHCTICNRAFTDSGQLNRHVRIHTGEKHHRCTFCDSAFSRSDSLKLHVKIHTGEKSYHCTICSRSFSQSSDLNRHIICHKGIKPFKCPHCDKKFSRKENLKSHCIMVHKLTNLDVVNS